MSNTESNLNQASQDNSEQRPQIESKPLPTKMGGSSATDDLDHAHRTQVWLAVNDEPTRSLCCARHHAGTAVGRVRLGRDSMDSTRAGSTSKERKQLCSTVR
jgi:hypothetical protein